MISKENEIWNRNYDNNGCNEGRAFRTAVHGDNLLDGWSRDRHQIGRESTVHAQNRQSQSAPLYVSFNSDRSHDMDI